LTDGEPDGQTFRLPVPNNLAPELTLDGPLGEKCPEALVVGLTLDWRASKFIPD
jgi:hypothetical protein